MFKKFVTIFAFMFVLALVIPVAAQRYGSNGRGNNQQRYDRSNRDRGHSNYRRDYDRGRNYRYANTYNYNRGRSYNRTRYVPVYNNYYYVRRAPVRRYYRPVYPRYYNNYRNRSRNRISISFGF